MTDKMKKSFEDQFGKEFMDIMYDMGFEDWMDNEREKDPMLRILEEMEKEFAEELEKKPEKKDKEKLAIPIKTFFDETKSLPDEFWKSLRDITDIPEHAYSIVINFDKDGIYIMDEDNTILYDDMDQINLGSVKDFAISISYLLYDFIRENFHD